MIFNRPNRTNTMHDAPDAPLAAAALGDRLGSALRHRAALIDVPVGAWARFQARSDTAVLDEPLFETAGLATDSEPAMLRPPAGSSEAPRVPRRGHRPAAARAVMGATGPRGPKRVRAHAARWRVPLLAAASVALLGGGIAVVATAAFAPDDTARVQAAAPGSAAAGDSAAVAVPVDASPEVAAVIPAGSGDVAPVSSVVSASAPMTATPPTVQLKFTEDAPPHGHLEASFQFDGPDDVSFGSQIGSDGSPLGYLGVSRGTPQGSPYLWGAVGPEVTQLQVIVATPPPTGADAAATVGSATWILDSGDGSNALTPSAEAASTWTEMPYGYHAFVLQLPPGSSSAQLWAVGAGDAILQAATLNLADGTRQDAAPAPAGDYSSESAGVAATTSTSTGTPDAAASLEAPGDGSVSTDGAGTPGYTTGAPALATTAPNAPSSREADTADTADTAHTAGPAADAEAALARINAERSRQAELSQRAALAQLSAERAAAAQAEAERAGG